MPRSYGRVATSIWRDKDFRNLTPEARFTYTMLFGQPNISAAGVLELTVTRWAGHTGYPLPVLRDALAELVEQGYVVIDEDAEELLIRSFVKWDGGANNDLRRKAIADAANVVASDELRAAIAVELDRIGVPHALTRPPVDPIEARRVVVTLGESVDPQPVSATGEPDATLGDAEPPSPFCSKHPKGTEKSCGPCGTAKLRYLRWVKTQPLEVAAKAAADAVALAECPHCDELGFVLDPETKTPTKKCTAHSRRSA